MPAGAPILRTHQDGLVITYPVAADDGAFDPRRTVVEYRGSEASSMPTTVLELGHSITCLLSEERSQSNLVRSEKVHHEALRPLGYEVGVIHLRDADEKAGRPDAALSHKARQAAAHLPLLIARCHHEQRRLDALAERRHRSPHLRTFFPRRSHLWCVLFAIAGVGTLARNFGAPHRLSGSYEVMRSLHFLGWVFARRVAAANRDTCDGVPAARRPGHPSASRRAQSNPGPVDPARRKCQNGTPAASARPPAPVGPLTLSTDP